MNRIVILAVITALLAATAVGQVSTNRTGLSPGFKFSMPAGSLPIINITQNTVIDTDVTPMPIEALSFTVQSGVTLTVTGSEPFYVKAALDIFVFGTIQASGQDGNFGGAAGPGGGAGGTNGQAGVGGPFAGQPATGSNGGGGGAGNAGTGADGTGPDGGVGGGGGISSPFASTVRAGFGGGASLIAPGDGIGGGGGGIVRLHAGGRIFNGGAILADGGDGDDVGGQFQITRGAGAGSGGAIELVTPLLQGSGAVFAEGGNGGDGIFQDGGDGGDGFITVRAGSIPSLFNFFPMPTVRPYGITLTPECPRGCVAVQPDFADFPTAFGTLAFLLVSGQLLPPGQEIHLGGGKTLCLDPNDALFDPAASPIYPLLHGQGSAIGGSLQTEIDVDFTPLLNILDQLALEQFSIFIQVLLIDPTGGVFDASDVSTIDFLTT